jgi:hypothetical protein
MPDLYLRSIEPLIVIVLGCIRWKGAQADEVRRGREPREGTMTFQISQRGDQYLKTAQTLLRAAETMADRAIAGQLKALADDYRQRAEKASRVDAARAFARSAANAEGE